jgi:hypothetical protein
MAYDSSGGIAAHIGTFLQLDSNGSGAIAGAANSKKYLLIEIAAGADLPNLSAAEAHITTGDWRKVCYELVNLLWSDFDAMATADEPGKVTASRGSLVGTGSTADRTYSFKFTLDTSDLEVIAE